MDTTSNSVVYLNGFSFAHPLPFFNAYEYYPPLVYWVTDAFYALSAVSDLGGGLSNVVWLSILVFATYGIGKTLWNAPSGGSPSFSRRIADDDQFVQDYCSTRR